MKGSSWVEQADPVTRTTTGILTLTEADRTSMHRDRLDLIDRATSMIQQALREPNAPTPQGDIRRGAEQLARKT